MKGLFNKTLVIALLATTVSGISAYQDKAKEALAGVVIGGSVGYTLGSLINALRDSESVINKGLRAAGSVTLQGASQAKDAAVTGFNVVKNSDFAGSVAQGASQAKDAAVTGLNAVKNSNLAQNLRVAGTAAKNGAVKAVELSKPALAAVLGYAMHAKDGVKSFYANHTEDCQVAAAVAAYVGFCFYVEYLARQSKINKTKQDCECESVQANQVTEATQVDVDELNSDVIA